MTSSEAKIAPRRRTYVRLLGEIYDQLNQALSEEHAAQGLTQADVARSLDVTRSYISKKMNGTSNMTLETLADLAFGLNRKIKVILQPNIAAIVSNHSRDPLPMMGEQSPPPLKDKLPQPVSKLPPMFEEKLKEMAGVGA